MALKILNINPVIYLVKNTIGTSRIHDMLPLGRSVVTEADSLEVRVGLKKRDKIDVFGYVTRDVPSGYLVVRMEGNEFTYEKPQYDELMLDIAKDLSQVYEVTYIAQLRAKNRPEKKDPGLL